MMDWKMTYQGGEGPPRLGLADARVWVVKKNFQAHTKPPCVEQLVKCAS